MNFQSAPPPVAATTNTSVVGIPPRIGTPVPGSSGGLPALPGLSVLQNPMAEQLRSQGRGEDSMLVHMTPNEVNSLQGLAMAHGGSLTINPNTGLPEAGFLKGILPTLFGGLLSLIPGVGPLMAAGIVGAGQTAITGDLGKGLMAGLGAYGGASLAGGIKGATSGVANTAVQAPAGQAVSSAGAGLGTDAATQAAIDAAAKGTLGTVPKTGLGGFMQGFSDTARQLPAGTPSFISKNAPMIAGMGVVNSISEATAPKLATYQPEKEESNYAGPYRFEERQVRYPTMPPAQSGDSSEFQYFNPVRPRLLDASGQPAFAPTQPTSGVPPYGIAGAMARVVANNPVYQRMAGAYNFADGGEVEMRDGSFVVDARTVSELGNGSSNAGIEMLSKLGGHPVRGSGDGVSDSVPARIGGEQEARVARDEVIFSPEAVRRIGGGSEARGTKKLYALMDKAHKARRQSARGKDTKVAKGLEALQ